MPVKSEDAGQEPIGQAQTRNGQRAPRLQGKDKVHAEDFVAALDRVYDLRRNCLLNELYYGYRLAQFRRLSLGLEIAIVIGTGASGVSGWVIWTAAPELKIVWAAIAALATLLAAIKPVVQFDKVVRRYGTLFSGYRELSVAMGDVVENISQCRCINLETEREVGRIRAKYRKLSENDDPRPSCRLVDRLQQQVNRRVSPEAFWYPAAGISVSQSQQAMRSG